MTRFHRFEKSRHKSVKMKIATCGFSCYILHFFLWTFEQKVSVTVT